MTLEAHSLHKPVLPYGKPSFEVQFHLRFQVPCGVCIWPQMDPTAREYRGSLLHTGPTNEPMLFFDCTHSTFTRFQVLLWSFYWTPGALCNSLGITWMVTRGLDGDNRPTYITYQASRPRTLHQSVTVPHDKLYNCLLLYPIQIRSYAGLCKAVMPKPSAPKQEYVIRPEQTWTYS